MIKVTPMEKGTVSVKVTVGYVTITAANFIATVRFKVTLSVTVRVRITITVTVKLTIIITIMLVPKPYFYCNNLFEKNGTLVWLENPELIKFVKKISLLGTQALGFC
jgi:hypothetical protein